MLNLSLLVILMLSMEAITAGDIISTRCCASKLEFARKLTIEIDKYEEQYNVARHHLTNIQQDCEIISTMVEYLQTSGCDGSSKLCDVKEFLKSFEGMRVKVLQTLKELRIACNTLNEMAHVLGNSSNCKYGYCLVGCANDRNILECKLKKFAENAIDPLYHSSIFMDTVEKTYNILGEQATNFCVNELNCNDSKGQCNIKNFLSEFVSNNRPGLESLIQLDKNCDLALSNINQIRAHITIGSYCC